MICKICGSVNKKYLFTKEGYRIVRCKQCKTVYLEHDLTLRDLIKEVYDPFYKEGVETLENKWCRRRWHREVHVINKLQPKGGNILDIGCSTGNFLELLTDNWKKYGVETCKITSVIAKKKGLHIFDGELPDASYPNEFFDVVTMYSVIEHLIDPEKIINEVSRILKNNGLLVVLTCNIDSMMSKLMGEHWSLYQIPTHLFYFSQKTLTNLLNKYGFWVKRSVHRGGGHFNNKMLRWIEYVMVDHCTILSHFPIQDGMTLYCRKREISRI